MGFNKLQTSKYTNLYNKKENHYNRYQNFLYLKNKIPYAKDFYIETNKAYKDMYLYYNILNEIQRQENKKTYLITFTNSNDLKNIKVKFFKKLNDLKKLKRFKNLEYDYFTILEPTKNQSKHLHIKLVVTNIKGLYTAIKKILSSMNNNKYTNIKLQKNSDKSNYLLKEPKNNKKAYIGWLIYNNISVRKAFTHSRYIKINEDIKITLTEYKRILSILLKSKSKSGYIGLEDIRKYILTKKTRKALVINAFNCLLYKHIDSIYNSKSSWTLYIYNNQVCFFCLSIIIGIDIKNNSPN